MKYVVMECESRRIYKDLLVLYVKLSCNLSIGFIALVFLILKTEYGCFVLYREL